MKRFFLIPIALVVFFFAFFLIYGDIKQRTIHEYTHEQLILARTASQGITSFFTEYQSDLNFLCQFQDMIVFSESGTVLMEKYYNEHRNILSATTRIDEKGIILHTHPFNPKVIGTDITYQKHVRQIIATHKPVISDVFTAEQGYRTIAMHVPVFNGKEYTGSLAILIPIDKLGELFLGSIRTRGNGEAWILSENGIELYCPLKGHTGKSFLELTRNDRSAVQLTEKIKSGKSGTALSFHRDSLTNKNDLSKEQYITFYRTPLGNTYWTILISSREKVIYEALTTLRNRLILIFTLLLGIVLFYFYSLVKVRNVLKEQEKRKKAEMTLLENEEKFRRLFEDHSAVKLLIDPKTGGIIDGNKAASAYYGWSREELKQMKLEQINTLKPEEIRNKLNIVIENKSIQFEVKHRLKDGSVRNVEVYSSKIQIGDRDILHSIVHDITERKRIEEALIEAKKHAEESDRLKTAFLQNMSHEIRTPMNAIMGFSSLLTDHYNDRPKLEQYSDIIRTRCNDLLEIINDILDISKIESGQLIINNEECNLRDLYSELALFFKEHQIRIKKQHIQFKLNCDCRIQDVNIITDKVKLRQILINLIGNAFKYTNEGTIEGGCKYDAEGQLLFYVSDTGIGVPADKQDIIFERFVQLHNEKTMTAGGTGLGLSIVKGLVELFGGKIWLKSEPDKGTTIYFLIPLVLATPKNADKVSGNIPEYHFNNQTILVVEDDHYNTEYVKAVLQNTGLQIIYTESGNDAVKIAKSMLPDLVLMDIRLPDISGYEATRQIKMYNPNQKIIAQTAYATTEDKQKAFEAGCNDYISKPIKRELLLSMIQKYLLKHGICS